MGIHGIDVSEFQGVINWSNAKSDGGQILMLRAGYGNGVIDLQFRRNAQSCNDEGIPFGVYWLSYAYTSEMARQEAESCIETIEEFKVSYPVCIRYGEDAVRYAKSLGVMVTEELKAEIVKAFCERVNELGYETDVFIES